MGSPCGNIRLLKGKAVYVDVVTADAGPVRRSEECGIELFVPRDGGDVAENGTDGGERVKVRCCLFFRSII